MPDRRAATPADAKAAWESFERAGVTPTTRSVAEKLAQSGEFHPVSKSTIDRWHKKGWAPIQPGANVQAPAAEQVAAKVEAAVSVLTGDATKRVEDVVTDAKADGKADDLEGKSVNELAEIAQRENYIATILLLRQVQAQAAKVEAQPKEMGALQQALSGSLAVSHEGMAGLLTIQERLMKVVSPDGNATTMPAEQDPLSGAIDAFTKAGDVHG